MFENIVFAYPKFFYLLLILVPYIVWYIFKHNQANPSIQVSTVQAVINAPKTLRYYLRHLLFVLRNLVLVALIIILARPQTTNKWQDISTEGIDIVMTMDISSSMLARDFKPDRLEASKELASQFISGRENDRFGLVIFAGESFTQCPLTTDRAVLINLFHDVESGMIDDGTAIGEGLATAVNRLKESKAKSKVIVLLTDGENNRGVIDPLTAAEIAKAFDVRVYTIGVGTIGTAPYPVQSPFGGITYKNLPVKIDEDVLTKIADLTGGKYFRATDNKKLEAIYAEIDQLEKTKIEVKKYSRKEEKYLLFAFIAAFLLVLELGLRNTILRRIP